MLDPFAGGGTTLAVAQSMNLYSVGVDLNAGFCDVMAERLGAAPRTLEQGRTATAG